MSPIQIQLAPPSPEIRLWFRADNRSNIDVELDRLLVEVWYPQPVAEGAILHRQRLAPNKVVDTLMFHAFLGEPQATTMHHAWLDKTQSIGLRIYAHAYFNTSLGTAHIEAMITREKGEFPIHGPWPPAQ